MNSESQDSYTGYLNNYVPQVTVDTDCSTSKPLTQCLPKLAAMTALMTLDVIYKRF